MTEMLEAIQDTFQPELPTKVVLPKITEEQKPIDLSTLRLPSEARDKIILWRKKGLPVFLKSSIGSYYNTVCKNCNDTGSVWLQFVISGPSNNYPNYKPADADIANKDGFWYIVENEHYRCPACLGAFQGVVTKKEITSSGLTIQELEYQLDYILGMDGKMLAHRMGIEIQGRFPNPSGLYFFYGDFGRGKSGILMSLVAYYINKGGSAKYLRYADYLDLVRGKDGEFNVAPKVRANLNRYKLLAIDEVGKGRGSDSEWALGETFQLFDDRYRHEQTCCTVIASNNSPDELWPYLRDRIKKAEVIQVRGKNLRS